MNRKASYSLHIQPLFTASQRACMLGKLSRKSAYRIGSILDQET
jgi:hypothetical protein